MSELQIEAGEPRGVQMVEAERPKFTMEELKQKVDLFLEEAAFYLDMAPRTLYNSWRARGLVAYKNHQGRLFWKRAELDHYLKTSRRRA